MYRVVSLSRHVGWVLLHPEPHEQYRGIGWAMVYLLLGLFFAGWSVALFFPVLLEGGYGWAFGLSFGPSFGLYWALFGVLHALSPRRRRVVFGLRLALTAAFQMVALSLPLVYAREPSLDPFFEPFLFRTVAVLVLLLFCRNYFVNLYRDRRAARSAT